MAEKLTDQQKMAINDRGGSLLVSAAAGSGKTKVLVDRLLSYVMDPEDPADLDEFLIITYTKAAASELRGKIAAKLTERVAENPKNRHLQRQMQRLYLTKISTVHSFCSDILKENAYRLDLPADFRMAEDTECEQMQAEVLERILDEAYENIEANPDLQAFVDTQGLGRDDRQVPEIIQKVYNSSRCHMNPRKWLDECVDMTEISSLDDASETPWGAYLIQDLHECIQLHLDAFVRCQQLASITEGMEGVTTVLDMDIQLLHRYAACRSWDDVHNAKEPQWTRFPSKYSDKNMAERIKAVRNACKEDLKKKLTSFTNDSQRTLQDMEGCCAASRGLIYLVEQFSERYDKLKKARRVMDFSDLEHSTLDLLLGKSRSGLTTAAKELGQRFREIMVDEYQDSNAVQDAIFDALTHQRNNCFMVGDVKQSIYQFRLADPTIFLDKYNRFSDAGKAKPGEPRKVLLSHNFRSSGQVIHAVNDVFSHCMSPKVGGLVYGEGEMLHEGIPHTEQCEPEIELHALQVQEDTYEEEAAFTAQRIRELLDGSHTIRSGDSYRPITPDDIVILLRSPGSVGLNFCYALQDIGIPCSMGGGENLLETEEITALYSLLQTISNPLQDISLTATLRSRIFCFTADDLAYIRGDKKYLPFYESLKRSDHHKAKQFLEVLSDLRHQARMCSITQLIEYIFAKTSMDSVYAAMTDGPKRIANLQEFCRVAAGCESNGRPDLEQFLEHLEALSQKEMIVTSDQKPAGSVTVMSIHKSKGLEFPVVFLCGLSRQFNQRSAQEQVLCDRELGLGLACVDASLRLRYPSAAKRAISMKIKAEGISEEMRVLYVALTRAKDRLIMTYASQHLKSALTDIGLRIDLSSPLLMTYDVGNPGKWILQTAMVRTEAGELHAIGGHPDSSTVSKKPWLIRAYDVVVDSSGEGMVAENKLPAMPYDDVQKIKRFLDFHYPHFLATGAPSKQTATQLKGRIKDQEAAANTRTVQYANKFRKPSFVEVSKTGTTFGNAVHALMQHIDFAKCLSVSHVKEEISRITQLGYLPEDLAAVIDPGQIASFFQTEIGKQLQNSDRVLREFKFSILDDAEKYVDGLAGERVLLQGVVDCALIEDDGITIVDFKTDKVTEATIQQVTTEYTPQITAYAEALSRIYQKKIKAAYLYFFQLNTLIDVT